MGTSAFDLSKNTTQSVSQTTADNRMPANTLLIVSIDGTKCVHLLPPPRPTRTSISHFLAHLSSPFVCFLFYSILFNVCAIRGTHPLVERAIRSQMDFMAMRIIYHPFSCSNHKSSWPGNDPTLNDGFKGDL